MIIDAKLDTAAPMTTACIIAVASSTVYLSKLIRIVILKMPIELPVRLHKPHAIGISK